MGKRSGKLKFMPSVHLWLITCLFLIQLLIPRDEVEALNLVEDTQNESSTVATLTTEISGISNLKDARKVVKKDGKGKKTKIADEEWEEDEENSKRKQVPPEELQVLQNEKDLSQNQDSSQNKLNKTETQIDGHIESGKKKTKRKGEDLARKEEDEGGKKVNEAMSLMLGGKSFDCLANCSLEETMQEEKEMRHERNSSSHEQMSLMERGWNPTEETFKETSTIGSSLNESGGILFTVKEIETEVEIQGMTTDQFSTEFQTTKESATEFSLGLEPRVGAKSVMSTVVTPSELRMSKIDEEPIFSTTLGVTRNYFETNKEKDEEETQTKALNERKRNKTEEKPTSGSRIAVPVEESITELMKGTPEGRKDVNSSVNNRRVNLGLDIVSEKGFRSGLEKDLKSGESFNVTRKRNEEEEKRRGRIKEKKNGEGEEEENGTKPRNANIDQVENKFHLEDAKFRVPLNESQKLLPVNSNSNSINNGSSSSPFLIGLTKDENGSQTGNSNYTVDIASISVEIINDTRNNASVVDLFVSPTERVATEAAATEPTTSTTTAKTLDGRTNIADKHLKGDDDGGRKEWKEVQIKKEEMKDENPRKKNDAGGDEEDGREEDEEDEDRDLILPRRRCSEERLIEVNWNVTDAGVLALRPCPPPYIGSVYRPCFSSGTWGKPDYTECRLPHLREIQNLIFYHVHKHLVDGLYPLAEELSRLVTSSRFTIRSPMDRLDAFDALNAILRSKIKIRLEDEAKDVSLIRSLISTADQLLTKTREVSFAVEAEKNALITMKSAETIFGLRLLSENILRALIVFCNDGTISKIKSIPANTEDIVLFLKHRTPFGALIPLLSPSGEHQSNEDEEDGPRVNVHLEEFKKLGVGLSVVWIKNLGSQLNNRHYTLISDLVLVSVVPAVSIEVDFQQIPQIEIELKLNQFVSSNDPVKCGRMKTSRELWTNEDCKILRRNASQIHCQCKEIGAIGVLQQKAVESTSFERNHRFSCHLNKPVIYTSSALSLLLLIGSTLSQLLGIRKQSREVSFILINLLSALSAIQLIFLLGGPFQLSTSFSASSSSFPSASSLHQTPTERQICRFVALLLHYIHLVSGFWMLSHTIYLYQRLWRPIASNCSLPASPTSPCPSTSHPHLHSQHHHHHHHLPSSSSSSSYPYSECEPLPGCPPASPNWMSTKGSSTSLWGTKHFAFLSWIVPALIVLSSYILNSVGYESRRYCWMSIEGGMMYSFIVPVSLLIMTNTVVMLLVLRRFFAHKPIIHKIEIERTQPALRAGVTLLPFFAVNWFLSVLALEDTATTIFQYIFGIVNTIQAFLVFLFLAYQRHEINHCLRLRLFRGQKKPDKSSLRLKKSYQCRSLRADIPRLYLGGDDPSTSSCLPGNLSSTGCPVSGVETDRCDSSDSQPLLIHPMPYSSGSSSDPSLPSTSRMG